MARAVAIENNSVEHFRPQELGFPSARRPCLSLFIQTNKVGDVSMPHQLFAYLHEGWCEKGHWFSYLLPICSLYQPWHQSVDSTSRSSLRLFVDARKHWKHLCLQVLRTEEQISPEWLNFEGHLSIRSWCRRYAVCYRMTSSKGTWVESLTSVYKVPRAWYLHMAKQQRAPFNWFLSMLCFMATLPLVNRWNVWVVMEEIGATLIMGYECWTESVWVVLFQLVHLQPQTHALCQAFLVL